jgi:hypothetical protein
MQVKIRRKNKKFTRRTSREKMEKNGEKEASSTRSKTRPLKEQSAKNEGSSP